MDAFPPQIAGSLLHNYTSHFEAASSIKTNEEMNLVSKAIETHEYRVESKKSEGSVSHEEGAKWLSGRQRRVSATSDMCSQGHLCPLFQK